MLFHSRFIGWASGRSRNMTSPSPLEDSVVSFNAHNDQFRSSQSSVDYAHFRRLSIYCKDPRERLGTYTHHKYWAIHMVVIWPWQTNITLRSEAHRRRKLIACERQHRERMLNPSKHMVLHTHVSCALISGYEATLHIWPLSFEVTTELMW